MATVVVDGVVVICVVEPPMTRVVAVVPRVGALVVCVVVVGI